MGRHTLEYTVVPIRELDGHYLGYQVWTRELDEEAIEEGVVCQAFDEDDMEIGKPAIDGAGRILIVEVAETRRRQGIATTMLRVLREYGYQVEHDWDNMRDDGAAWAQPRRNTPEKAANVTVRTRTVLPPVLPPRGEQAV